MINAETVNFDTPQLARAVEAMPLAAIDRLPFGAVHVDRHGAVSFYSKREGQLSGFGDRPVLGLQFFEQIAPCMKGPFFKGRIEEAQAAGLLDLEFSHVGDFADRARELHVRAQSASGGGIWLFIAR
ncbi:Photoactive yellow protein [Burkholderiales bacterium 8X]|nr:Photoactive yellow protein [Burkholderiales bacterium 8X]